MFIHVYIHQSSQSGKLINAFLSTEKFKVATRGVPLVENELPTLPEHPSSLPAFSGVRVVRSVVFCLLFCRSLFFLFLLAIVLSFFVDFRILFTPLVSLNSLKSSFVTVLIAFIQLKLEIKDTTKPVTIVMISIFSLCSFYLHVCVVTFQQNLHNKSFSFSWYEIPELPFHIRISFIESILLTIKLHNQGFLLLKSKLSLKVNLYGSHYY